MWLKLDFLTIRLLFEAFEFETAPKILCSAYADTFFLATRCVCVKFWINKTRITFLRNYTTTFELHWTLFYRFYKKFCRVIDPDKIQIK